MQAGGSPTPPTPTPYNEPFYVEDLSGTQNNTLTIYKVSASAPDLSIEYSYDATTWVSMGSTNGTSYVSPITTAIPFNGKVYLRCSTNAWATNYNTNVVRINATNIFCVGGNSMSLLYGSNFTGNEKEFPNTNTNYVFASLFAGSNNERNLLYGDCSKMLMPAKTLTMGCYWSTFQSTFITVSPTIEATTANKSYVFQGTFAYCYLLNKATILVYDWGSQTPATNTFQGINSSGVLIEHPDNTKHFTIPSTWYMTTTDVSVEPMYDMTTTQDFLVPFYVEDDSGSANTLSITKNNASANDVIVEYSTDKITWQTLGTTSTTALTLSIPANGKIYLRSTTDAWGKYQAGYNIITCSDYFKVGGNISSLLYGSNFTGYEKALPNISISATFAQLFNDAMKLRDAKDLIIPYQLLSSWFSWNMFNRCSSLLHGALFYTQSCDRFYSYQIYGTYQYCSALLDATFMLKFYAYTNNFSGVFTNVSTNGTLYKHPNSTIWVAGTNIPSTWTTQDYNV